MRAGDADVLVSQVRDAVSAGHTGEAVRYATHLARSWPEVRAWAEWVIAGCHALDGAPDRALTVLLRADFEGLWWDASLLSDPSLAAVWDLPGARQLRERSVERAAPGARDTEPEWLAPRAGADVRCVVVALHGNGPLPLTLQRRLWSDVPQARVLAVRSPLLVTPGTGTWRDPRVASTQVAAAVAVARRAERDLPVVLVGLGAGGTVAARLAADPPPEVWGAVVVAAPPPRADTAGTPAAGTARQPRAAVVAVHDAGDADGPRWQMWADERQLPLVRQPVDGLGHAFPRDFGVAIGRAVARVLADRGDAADHDAWRGPSAVASGTGRA